MAKETAGSPAARAERWRDHKRYLWVVALVMPLLPFVAIGLHQWTGLGVWLWLGPLVILGVVPIVDWTVGRDSASVPDDMIAALEGDRYYRWLTYAFLPLQYAGFIAGMFYIAQGGLSTWESIGMAVTLGFIGGLGINTAHELGHKRDDHERWLSKIALAQCAYGHFFIEHNRGHHVRVATPEDPASSRLGESFYRYWPRTVGGSLASAWRLERQRLTRRKGHAWRLRNDVLNAWLMTIVLWAAIIVLLGPSMIGYLLLQAFIGITLLEAVNYLEHYGLLRQVVKHGDRERYERVEPRHSWNSNNVATNVLLYHLQRHSDHHAHPTRRYQALQDDAQAPVLPTGYSGMILLALVPPLWRRVMDPRVIAHYDGDASLANIAPKKRQSIMTRYAHTAPSSSVKPAITDAGDSQVRPMMISSAKSAQCPECGYVYDSAAGAVREGFAPGTPWSAVPDTWICPDCGVRDKSDFRPVAARN
ncbi:MAG: fatty acid desaturase [Candidatus Nanopelagicales bacterium]